MINQERWNLRVNSVSPLQLRKGFPFMSDLSPLELLELKDTRKKLTMGIVWAAKRFGSDSKEVFIARAALKHLDEYIAEMGYDTAFFACSCAVRAQTG